jgi:predicted DNA-binding transcriptional regulator YafY
VLNADTLAALLRAMREKHSVEVLYQSMTQVDPQPRVISPHAFAHDGYRWHVRAYCHLRKQFRDFVIARILKIEPAKGIAPAHQEDGEWQTMVELVIAPNPKLPASHRRAIELDYGMTQGQARIVCRQALLFYILQHLGLDQESGQRPEAHQIVLKNRKVVESYLQARKLV